MNTGIILGLGLITIIVCFYIMLNIPYWFLFWNKRKNQDLELDKHYHQWVYSSDDVLNKILKLCVCSLYSYGIYIFIFEIWSKFTDEWLVQQMSKIVDKAIFLQK